MFEKSGYRARIRTSLRIDNPCDFDFGRTLELNIKSNHDRKAHEPPRRGARKEYEAHASSFKKSFNAMLAHPSAGIDKKLDFKRFNRKSTFTSLLGLSSRAHGEFAYRLEDDLYVREMPSNDHTIYLENYLPQTPYWEDCESEYEGKSVITIGPKSSKGRARKLSPRQVKDALERAEEELRSYLTSIDPNHLLISHRSKMGRGIKRLARTGGISEAEALERALARRISVPDFLGDTDRFKERDFSHNLVSIARQHLLTGDDLVKDYIQPKENYVLAIA
jgi:hypothetical protein